MNRQEQLVFCRKCTNRKTDPFKGIICGLTNNVATFEGECADYNLDESVKERVSFGDDEGVQVEEIRHKISADAYERLRLDQSLPKAIIFGAAASLIGALLWAVITVVTEFQIGFMALAIGALVGIAVRQFGKGVDNIFGIWGAGLALIGCVLGNFFSIVGVVSHELNIGYFEVLNSLGFNVILELMVETFSFMDIVFYGIALYEGYRFSFRKLSESDLAKISVGN